jgi:putative ABC transport system ATP-binding protein
MNRDLTNATRSGTTRRTTHGFTPGGGPRATGGAGTLPRSSVAAAALGIRKTYGTGDTSVVALDDVTLEIPSGSFVAIMGPSGSGKSTLLHCLAGLDTPDSGRVLVGGQDLATLSDTRLTVLRRERVGFVFQAFNLVPALTARENIVLPCTLGRVTPDPEWVDAVVDAVGLGDRLGHRPHELSGGQQQRVAVARALVTRPAIVFADEPTGNLDSRSSAEVLGFLRRAVDDWGQTVALVTHDPVAASYADTVVALVDGRIAHRVEDPSVERVVDLVTRLEV